jgi:hypothetical protein
MQGTGEGPTRPGWPPPRVDVPYPHFGAWLCRVGYDRCMNLHRAFLLAIIVLPGCGFMTTYRPLKPSGGFYEIPTSDGRMTVVIASNGSRIGPVLDSWLMYRCAQLTLDAGKSHFRVLAKDDTSPGSHDYGVYRTATIEMLDSASGGDVYDAASTALRTAPHLRGPARYR